MVSNCQAIHKSLDWQWSCTCSMEEYSILNTRLHKLLYIQTSDQIRFRTWPHYGLITSNTSNHFLCSSYQLLGARTLLGAKGIATRNKKLLGTRTLLVKCIIVTLTALHGRRCTDAPSNRATRLGGPRVVEPAKNDVCFGKNASNSFLFLVASLLRS